MKISYNNSPKKNLIGEKVCRLRKEGGYSQRSLAAKLQKRGYDFTELTILRIEKGIRLVTDIELKILCDVLETNPNEILDFKDKPSRNNHKET